MIRSKMDHAAPGWVYQLVSIWRPSHLAAESPNASWIHPLPLEVLQQGSEAIVPADVRQWYPRSQASTSCMRSYDLAVDSKKQTLSTIGFFSTISSLHLKLSPHFLLSDQDRLLSDAFQERRNDLSLLLFKVQLYQSAELNGWQLAKMKKSIPDMSLPWNL